MLTLLTGTASCPCCAYATSPAALRPSRFACKREDAELNAKIAARREEICRLGDKPMIEKVAQRMGEREFWSLKLILLSIEGASARVRRWLERLTTDEKAGATTPAGPMLARTA